MRDVSWDAGFEAVKALLLGAAGQIVVCHLAGPSPKSYSAASP